MTTSRTSRRAIFAVAAGLVGTGAFVALSAAPAFAYRGDITGVAECVTSDGTYTVTWTLTNDMNVARQGDVVAVRGGGSINPGHATAPGDGSVVLVQSGIPGTSTSAGITIDYEIGPNGAPSGTESRDIALPGTPCTKVTPTPTPTTPTPTPTSSQPVAPVITPTPTASTTSPTSSPTKKSTPAASDTQTEAPATTTPAAGTLPRTGGSAGTLAVGLIGAGALLGGAGLVVAARRPGGRHS
ncbi:MAG: LPXTG cell wall anchor domain-containing protein [Actinomycetota bacterium]|nr:MAG: LPXTG cell wall anchor domain-containing protein [Actinomycetota bacterium]